jgi:hypothetical protein
MHNFHTLKLYIQYFLSPNVLTETFILIPSSVLSFSSRNSYLHRPHLAHFSWFITHHPSQAIHVLTRGQDNPNFHIFKLRKDLFPYITEKRCGWVGASPNTCAILVYWPCEGCITRIFFAKILVDFLCFVLMEFLLNISLDVFVRI